METKDITMLLSMGERINFETKKAEKSIPKSIWETYSAFANTIGGYILLGISEEKEGKLCYTTTGIKEPEKLKKELFDTLNSDKVSTNILTDDDVEVVKYEDRFILSIHVPQADYRQRPIYINGNLNKGTYKRNHEGDYHCTEEEVKAMIRDSNDAGNDGILIDHYNMEDIDLLTLSAFRNRFHSANPEHLLNDYDDKEFLRNLGGYTKDRATGREGLTLAGLLMFGKGLAIRERFDNIRLDYLDMTNLQPDSRWSDRITYDGSWENNLYNFFTRVLVKLVRDIKRPFVLKGAEREDDTPLHKAIREALTNLVIHADYMIEGVLRVEKHDDRFFFSNPGSLKLPIADIYKGGNSKARNPHIQSMLRMLGYGDNIGSGFPTIVDACKKENWRKPLLCESNELHTVELTISMKSVISEECIQQLRAILGETTFQSLDNEAVLILSVALTEDTVTNSLIQTLLDKNSLQVGKLLYSLVERNILVSQSKGRWTSYEVNRDFIKIEKSRSKAQGVANEKSRSKTQGVTDENSRSKRQGVADEKARSKRQGVADEKARSKSKEEKQMRILEFCQTPRTLLEIAKELNLSDRYKMKQHYIDTLLLEGKLCMMQKSKTAPTQKYMTTEAIK